MKGPKNKKNNSVFNNDGDEINRLLETCYQPDYSEMQNFDDFFSEIEEKIEASKPHYQASTFNNQIEAKLLNREQKLNRYRQRLEDRQKHREAEQQVEVKRPEKRKTINSKLFLATFIIAMLGLASIASLRNHRASQLPSSSSQEYDWQKLNLSAEQKKQMTIIDKELENFVLHSQAQIQIRKEKLLREINKDHPDFAIIDKYERDILDIEASLKQAKHNSFVEKRFLLSEQQSIALIKTNLLN